MERVCGSSIPQDLTSIFLKKTTSKYYGHLQPATANQIPWTLMETTKDNPVFCLKTVLDDRGVWNCNIWCPYFQEQSCRTNSASTTSFKTGVCFGRRELVAGVILSWMSNEELKPTAELLPDYNSHNPGTLARLTGADRSWSPSSSFSIYIICSRSSKVRTNFGGVIQSFSLYNVNRKLHRFLKRRLQPMNSSHLGLPLLRYLGPRHYLA